MSITGPRVVLMEPMEGRRLLASTMDALTVEATTFSAADLSQPLAVVAAEGPTAPTVTYIQSPNFNNRPAGQDIDAIVVHTTEGSYQSAVNTFLNPANQVSAHYIINSDGAITQMVELDKRAWHATYYNSRSVGIEMVGFAGQPGTWNASNLAALENLTAWLADMYDVPVAHPSGNAYDYPNDQLNVSGIVAHGQVQPWNRTDPGPYFPWSTFISNVQQIIDAPVGQTIDIETAAFVRGGRYATWNWGNNADLVVKNSRGGENTRETWLKFDLTGVSTISSAKLQLFGSLNASHDSSVRVNVYGSNNHWTERGINYNNKPPLGWLRGSFAVSGTTDQTYEIDLTTFLKSEKAAGRNVFTLVLRAASITDSQAVFDSDDAGNGPKLVVNG